jgi:hypothetical protein
MIWLNIKNTLRNFGLPAARAQVAVLSDLNIRIAIVLVIYFAIMLAIAILAHVLTKKYNDK